MKTCITCRVPLPREAFYAHPQMADGLLGACKECCKAASKEHYRATRPARQAYEKARQTPERRAANQAYLTRSRLQFPEKYRARTAVNNAVRDGRLTKTPCEVCGALKVEAHHEDYSQPLSVMWLCRTHHYAVHDRSVIAGPF